MVRTGEVVLVIRSTINRKYGFVSLIDTRNAVPGSSTGYGSYPKQPLYTDSMDTPPVKSRISRHHIDTKLRIRLLIYAVVALVTLGITAFHVVRNDESPPVASASLVLGFVVGLLSARMFHVSWDGDTNKVIARLDVVGGMILVAYIVFTFLKDQLLGTVVPTAELGAATVAVTAGVMVGRVVGTRGHIRSVLDEMMAQSDKRKTD